MHILNLFGSTQDQFYYDLSKMYADAVLSPTGVTHHFASVDPNGIWRFGPSTERLGEPVGLADALRVIGTPDLMVPHMFCKKGMTAFRSFFDDLLGIPVVGAPATVAGLATSKLWTRDLAAAAGVTVAKAERIDGDLPPALPVPYVIKPNSEDNSLGISVVAHARDAAAAIAHARKFDPIIFAEEFIPGREIRVAVVETSGELLVPSFIEYPVSGARPIREVADKLERSGESGIMRQSQRPDSQPVCPAEVGTDLAQALSNAAKTAHRALGARHYSLFDFRVHAQRNVPYLLEAGLFWSFSSLSAITKMLKGSDLDADQIALEIWKNAASEHKPSLVETAA